MDQLQVGPENLESSTGIRSQRLAELLAGTSEPTGDEVLILADYFKCDFKFFISNERLAPFEQTESLFRKHGADLSREDRWAIQEFLFLCECQEFLLTQSSQNRRNQFAFNKRGNYFKRQGEEAAVALRRHMGLDTKEIPSNIFRVLRDIGIHVFRRTLVSSTISGLCVRHPTAGTCVLINYEDDVFRQRFSAAHEAGHAILDSSEDFVVSFKNWKKGDLSEIRANRFASCLLLPSEMLNALPDPTFWTDEEFLSYAGRLMVNVETLAYALGDAGLISDDKASAFRKLRLPKSVKVDAELPDSLGTRSRERKVELLRRGLSDSYVSLCFDSYDRGVITAGRLAEMLLVSETELLDLASLYGRALSHGD